MNLELKNVKQKELLQITEMLQSKTNYNEDGSYLFVKLTDIKTNIYYETSKRLNPRLNYVSFDVTLESPDDRSSKESMKQRRDILNSLFNIVDPL